MSDSRSALCICWLDLEFLARRAANLPKLKLWFRLECEGKDVLVMLSDVCR